MKKPKSISSKELKGKFQPHELSQIRYLLGILAHFSPEMKVGELREMISVQ